jgi:hypothetical protein
LFAFIRWQLVAVEQTCKAVKDGCSIRPAQWVQYQWFACCRFRLCKEEISVFSGFPCEYLKGMREALARKALGNAIPPPMFARAFLQALQALAKFEKSPAYKAEGGPIKVVKKRPAANVLDMLMSVRRRQ